MIIVLMPVAAVSGIGLLGIIIYLLLGGIVAAIFGTIIYSLALILIIIFFVSLAALIIMHINKKTAWALVGVGILVGTMIGSNEYIYKHYISHKISTINNLTETEQIKILIKYDANAIAKIDNPSEKVQLAAVKEEITSIKYIKNPSEKVQLIAVKKDPRFIGYIKKPTEKVQLFAVQSKSNISILPFIEKPTKKVQLVAVNFDPGTINQIKNPSKEVQLAILKHMDKIMCSEGIFNGYLFLEYKAKSDYMAPRLVIRNPIKELLEYSDSIPKCL